jgi:hypothetical protein
VSFLEQELILDPFYRYWSIPEMETVEGYKRAFDAAGLTMIEFDDLSKNVMPNWVSGCDKACQSLKDPLTADKLLAIAKATARFGPLGLQYAKDQFYAVAFARLAADAGLLQYCLFVAEKKLV